MSRAGLSRIARPGGSRRSAGERLPALMCFACAHRVHRVPAEVGASAGDFVTLQGIVAPKGLPPAVLEIFTDAVTKTLANPELRDTPNSTAVA